MAKTKAVSKPVPKKAAKKSTAELVRDAGINIAPPKAVPADRLKALTALADELRTIDRWFVTAGKQIEEKTTRRNELVQQLLPDRMTEVGMAEFRLVTGELISIKDILSASIPTETAIEKEKDSDKKTILQERRKAAFEWLKRKDVGAASLIKTEVVAMFGKGAEKQAIALTKTIAKMKIPVICEQAVHTQTLNKFLREIQEAGKIAIPVEPFALYTGKVAQIEKPKTK